MLIHANLQKLVHENFVVVVATVVVAIPSVEFVTDVVASVVPLTHVCFKIQMLLFGFLTHSGLQKQPLCSRRHFAATPVQVSSQLKFSKTSFFQQSLHFFTNRANDGLEQQITEVFP